MNEKIELFQIAYMSIHRKRIVNSMNARYSFSSCSFFQFFFFFYDRRIEIFTHCY